MAPLKPKSSTILWKNLFSLVLIISPFLIKEKLLHKLEQGRLYPVKEYSRPAAGMRSPAPSDIRTVGCLVKTINYLCSTVYTNSTAAPSNIVFDFMFDRLRAVRQDLILQNVEDGSACQILAQIVRFHVLSSLLQKEYTIDKFDPVRNSSHLLECVKSVLILQNMNDVVDEEREEMNSIYILSNLSSSAPLMWATNLPDKLRKSANISNSFQLALLFRQNNFVRYFRLLQSLPPLLQIAALKFTEKMTVQALKVYSVGYHSVQCKYPLTDLSKTFFLNQCVMTDLCTQLGLQLEGDNVKFQKSKIPTIEDESTLNIFDFNNVSKSLHVIR